MSMPPGTYRARCPGRDSVQFGWTLTGKEQIAVAFRLLQEPFVGQYMTYFGFFTEKTMESTLKALRACGWAGDDMTDMTGIDANEVDLVIEDETGQDGKVYSKVRWVNELGGGRVKLAETMTPDQHRAFAAKMKGTAVAQRQGTLPLGPKPPSRKAVKQDAIDHGAVDEVPF